MDDRDEIKVYNDDLDIYKSCEGEGLLLLKEHKVRLSL